MNRQSERGSLALFGISMAVVFLTVGGVSIELWNVLSQRRQISAVADAAAAAGATAIDEDAYRLDGSLVMVPELAVERAAASVAAQEIAAGDVRVAIRPSPDVIEVEIRAEVDLLILRIIGADPIQLGVIGRAEPFRGG